MKNLLGFVLIASVIWLGNQHVTQQKQKAFDNFSCGQHGKDCASFTSCKSAFMRAYNEHYDGGH